MPKQLPDEQPPPDKPLHFQVTLDDEDAGMLDSLASSEKLTKRETVRRLIRAEYQRQQLGQSTTPESPAAS